MGDKTDEELEAEIMGNIQRKLEAEQKKRADVASQLIAIAQQKGIPIETLMKMLEDPVAAAELIQPTPAYASQASYDRYHVKTKEEEAAKKKQDEDWAARKREERRKEMEQMGIGSNK